MRTLCSLVFLYLNVAPINITLKQYQVKNLGDKSITLSGKGDDAQWNGAIELDDFIYPWETVKPLPTSFRAMHNKDWLYCLYRVTDKNINVFVKDNTKREVLPSDRVEIFLRRDAQMRPYYGLEIDPHGRVYDYEAFLRQSENGEWHWPEGELLIKSSIHKDGYVVEFAISKKSLTGLGLIKDSKIEAGLFRGDCVNLNGGVKADIKWISWVKPDSPTPNFHIPSAFGLLILE